jgi:hypothetical protein
MITGAHAIAKRLCSMMFCISLQNKCLGTGIIVDDYVNYNIIFLFHSTDCRSEGCVTDALRDKETC